MPLNGSVDVGKFRFITEIPQPGGSHYRQTRGDGGAGSFATLPKLGSQAKNTVGAMSARNPKSLKVTDVALLPLSARKDPQRYVRQPVLGAYLFPSATSSNSVAPVSTALMRLASMPETSLLAPVAPMQGASDSSRQTLSLPWIPGRSKALEACDGVQPSAMQLLQENKGVLSVLARGGGSFDSSPGGTRTPTEGEAMSVTKHKRGTGALTTTKTDDAEAGGDLSPTTMDSQIMETRQALTSIGARLLYLMDMPKEAREFQAPHGSLPSKTKYPHLHGLQGVREVAGAVDTLSSELMAVKTLSKQDKQALEMLHTTQPSQFTARAFRTVTKDREPTPEFHDEAPHLLKWHYLLQNDANQPDAGAHTGPADASRATQLNSLSSSKGAAPLLGKTVMRTKAGSPQKSAKSKSLVPQKPTTTNAGQQLSKRSVEKQLALSAGDGSVETSQAKESGERTFEKEEVLSPEQAQVKRLQQDIRLERNVVHIPSIAEASYRRTEQLRINLRSKTSESDAKQRHRLALHEKTKGDPHSPELRSIMEADRSRMLDADAEVEWEADVDLFQRDPTVFAPTGEDTDVTDYPKFPFAQAERSAPPGSSSAGPKSSGFTTASSELTEEEKLHRKFERRLLVRQIQRNRQVVDDQDDPAIDWAAWRTAANSALQSVSAPRHADVAEHMQELWHQLIVSEMKGEGTELNTVGTLPCFAAQRVLQEVDSKKAKKE
jgi:hypothetical protein